MKQAYKFSTNSSACLLVLLRFAVFAFLCLCVQTISAQSKCLKDGDGVLLCDLSVSLIEEAPTTNPDVVLERAWQPTSVEIENINEQFWDFAEVWCEITLGKSRIQNISVLRGYKKSSADVAFYKNEGRSYSYVGSFAGIKPSIVVYYTNDSEHHSFDQFLGRVLAHEFSHATLKVYDEYQEQGRTSAEACADPLQSDNPRRTIMNDHRYYTRYSHPDDYTGIPVPSTAQYRCYGESAWEVLLQPEKCDNNLSLRINSWFPRRDYFAESSSCSPVSVPSVDTLINSRDELAVQTCMDMTRKNLNIKFVSGTENIVMVIDSGIDEMNKKIIGDNMTRIIYLLAQGVDIENILMNNVVVDQEAHEKRLALIDFNDDNLFGLKEVKENVGSLKQKLAAVLENNPQTRRGINQSLNSVKAIFENNSSLINNDYNTVTVISDTRTMPSDSALSFFKEKNIPVDTIAIGEKFNPGLKKLSVETGGEYYTIAPADHHEALGYAINNSLFTAFNQNIEELINIELRNSTTRSYVWIEEGAWFAYFSLFWPKQSRVDEFTVIPPENTQNRNPALPSQDSLGSHFFDYPQPGRWEVFIKGDGSFKYNPVVFYNTSLDVNVGTEILPRATTDEVIKYPAPIPIRARVHGRMPALYAHVRAQITVPNDDSASIELTLLDDGEAPDFRATDGVYTGILTDHHQYGDGLYTIKVIASNPNGEVVFDDTGIATFGGDLPVEPRPAPPFRLVSSHQVEVRGTSSNTDGDSSPRHIRSDGALNWGMIEREGHTNWYRFTADRTGIHYIQTSNLLNHGDTEMATNLKLYNEPSDGRDLSFLSENVAHRGTNVSHIAHTLDEGESYLVSVSHANNGRGVYGLTVSSANDLLSAHEITQSMNSGVGGGGGGFVGYLLIMLLPTVLIALYNRRENHRRIH